MRTRGAVISGGAGFLGRLLVLACGSAVVGACTTTHTRPLMELPVGSTLQVLDEVETPDSVAVSGIAGLPSCDVIIADRAGRIWLRRKGETGFAEGIAAAPGLRALTLELWDDLQVGIWSDIPPLVGVMSIQPFRIDSLPIPGRGGESASGQIVSVGSGRETRIAFSPFGNTDVARRAPAQSAPTRQLIEVLDEKGAVQGHIGPPIPAGEGYLPWLRARVVIGGKYDTLLLAFLEDGRLERYSLATGELLGGNTLPSAFAPAQPYEDILAMPWVQYGEMAFLYHTPKLQAASFGPEGYLFAVHAHGYVWTRSPSRFLRRHGSWDATGNSLGVYGPSGELAGVYELHGELSTLRIDAVGRIFLVYGTGRIVIAQNPFLPPSPCHVRS